MRDREIVAAVVAGDPAGLAAAYDTYASVLYNYCRSLLAESADAADAVQDTFVICAAKLDGLRDPDRLRPWLYAVARNECHRRLRARARFTSLDEAGDVTDTAEPEPQGADAAALKELVTAAVAGLNPGDREVIELNLRHDLAGGDLADALGVPPNQAHALASRARSQLERALGALLVARTGRKSCGELNAMLAGWDGKLTILLRKRISRHVESCKTCSERKRRELSPAMLFSVLPIFALPNGLRQQILRLVSDTSPDAAHYRDVVVQRAGQFGSSGFPLQVNPWNRGHGRGFRSHPAFFAGAAAVIIIAGGGGGAAAYVLSHHRHSHARVGPVVTLTITPPAAAATTVPAAQTSAPAVTPSRTSPPPSATPPPTSSAPPPPPPSPSATPSPTSSPGTLTVSTNVLVLTQPATGGPYSGTFAVTAVGGPVAFSISIPASEQAYFSVSPLDGTLQSGVSQMITVTVNGKPPNFENPVTVEPGAITIILRYPPSG